MQQSAFGSRKSPTRDPGVTMPKGRRLWSQVATTPFAVRHHLFHQPGRLRHGSGGFLATSQPPGVLVSVTLNTPIASDGQQTVSFAGRWGSRKGPASTRIDATLDRGCLHSLRRKSLCIDRLKDIHSRDLVDVKNPRGRLGLLHLWKRRGFARRRGKPGHECRRRPSAASRGIIHPGNPNRRRTVLRDTITQRDLAWKTGDGARFMPSTRRTAGPSWAEHIYIQ
jgi:hypothetical protein